MLIQGINNILGVWLKTFYWPLIFHDDLAMKCVIITAIETCVIRKRLVIGYFGIYEETLGHKIAHVCRDTNLVERRVIWRVVNARFQKLRTHILFENVITFISFASKSCFAYIIPQKNRFIARNISELLRIIQKYNCYHDFYRIIWLIVRNIVNCYH